MAESNQLVVFRVDDQRYALKLVGVERIVRAVEITHLPDAPGIVFGVINVEGRIVPVLNTRRRLGLPERDLELQDLFVIVNNGEWKVALVADEVLPVVEVPDEQIVASRKVLPGKGYVEGVAKMDDGMIIVLAVDKILSFDEHGRLSAAIEAIQGDTV
jgi:purine-binding chemotaxis protein CheW